MAELIVRVGAQDVALLRRTFGLGGSAPAPWTPPRVVVDAHVPLITDDLAHIARRAGVPFLVDPQTYFVQDRQHAGFAWTRLPYAAAEELSPDDLSTDLAVDHMVVTCIDHQLAAQATSIIAPYLHIERRDSGWIDVQARLWRATRQHLDREGIALDVIAVLALGWRLLHPIQGRAAISPMRRALQDLAPAEVAVAASRVHQGVRPDERLVELLMLVRRLGQQWPVLAWQQGLLGEACVAAGATGYETGIGWRERCDLQAAKSQHRSPPSPDGHPSARPVYVDVLKRSIPKKSLQRLRGRRGVWSRLLCTETDCCPPAGEGLLADARQHSINGRARALAALSQAHAPHWQWNHLANEAASGLTVAGLINAVAQRDPEIAKVDTAALNAIHTVAEHQRTRRRLAVSA